MAVSLPIWAVALALVALGVIALLLDRHHRRERRRLENETDQRIETLRREQTRQIERLRRERERAERTGHVDFVSDLLPALDGLRRATEQSRSETTSKEALSDGVEMTLQKIDSILDRYDIEPVEPQPGEPFDPELAEAVRAVDDAEVEAGAVVSCHRPGYRFRDRTLRPALVEVAVASGDDVESKSDGERNSSAEVRLGVEEDEPAEVNAETEGNSEIEEPASSLEGDPGSRD